MIPKASQRGLGQDLATHLLNALDNEYVEVAEVSWAVASDLHGAFAEWEAIAKGLTKCREYLYSLSVNPAPDQHLTRAQYLDYAERVEKKLGLEGQPRALVFHIKDGREHCHMIWSRIDWQSEKRAQLAARRLQKAGYLAQVRAVRTARMEARPRGLAAFLGRVTGVSLVIDKLHRHRDAKAWRAFAADRQALVVAQKQAALSLQRRQEVQALDSARQVKALGKVEAREKQALEVRRVREQRIIERHGHDHMPALTLELKPTGRSASVRRAKDRYRDRSGREEREAPVIQEDIPETPKKTGIDLQQAIQEAILREEPWSKEIDLAGDFARAAGDGSEDSGDRGDEGGEKMRISRAERKSERRRGRDDDFERER